MALDHRIRQRVHLRYRNLVRARFNKLGVGATSECEQELDKMISIGVSRLGHQRALEKEATLLMVEEILYRILTDLYERAQILGTFPMIDGKTFEEMKSRLSPMWPFL